MLVTNFIYLYIIYVYKVPSEITINLINIEKF